MPEFKTDAVNWTKRRGANAVPTALLVGLVSVVALTAVQTTGDSTEQLFTDVARTVSNDVAGGRKDLPGNDAPEFVAGSSVSIVINEDSGPVELGAQLGVNDPDQNQTLTWSEGSAPSSGVLSGFPASASTGFGGNHSPGSVTYEPTGDLNGGDSFSVVVTDGGDTDSVTVNVTIAGVNDQPSITLAGNQGATAGDGTVTVSSFATGFDPGAPDESGQSIAGFTVSEQSDTNNVVSNVAIDTSGTLTYDVAASATGTATIEVQVQDDGGTANGGVDTSDAQTFDIVVSSSTGYATGRLSGGNRDFVWLLLPANTNFGTVSAYRNLCEAAGFSNNRMTGNRSATTSWNTADFDAYSNTAYYASSYCNFFGAGNSRRNNVSNFTNNGLPLNTPIRLVDRGCGGYNNSHLTGINTTDRVTITSNSAFSFEVNHFGTQDYTSTSPASFNTEVLIVCQEL